MSTIYWSGCGENAFVWHLHVDDLLVLSLERYGSQCRVRLFCDDDLFDFVEDDLHSAKKTAVRILKQMLMGRIKRLWQDIDTYESVLSCL